MANTGTSINPGAMPTARGPGGPNVAFNGMHHGHHGHGGWGDFGWGLGLGFYGPYAYAGYPYDDDYYYGDD
jgi:hypothetical protein